MKDLQDFSKEPAPSGSEPRPTQKRPLLIGLAILVLVLAALLFFLRREPSQVAQSPTPGEAADSQPAEPETAELESPPRVELPPLDESDEWMREVAAQLSANPGLAKWLLAEDLIRRFVVVVDNVAQGVSPRVHLPFLLPEEPFETQESSGRLTIDPQSYRRYDGPAAVADSLDVRGTAELYRSVKPLIQAAYEDLGYPGRDFDDTLAQAVRQLRKTPRVEDPIELVPKVSSYALADEDLESLNAVQKHFLRMGPQNLRSLQDTALKIVSAIGIPEEKLRG